MKSQLLQRAAMGAAVLLPLGGIAFVGVQNAGATAPVTKFTSGDTLKIVTNATGSPVVTVNVDLSTGSDGSGAGCGDATGKVAEDGSGTSVCPYTISSTSGTTTYTVTIPVGGIVSLDDGTVGTGNVNDLFITNATASLGGTGGFSGCSLAGFTSGANGQVEFNTVGSKPYPLNIVKTTGKTYYDVTSTTTVGGSCTSKTTLQSEVTAGVRISNASALTATNG